MKKIWVSAFSKGEKEVGDLIAKLKGYGIEAHGHLWRDEIERMSWMAPRENILADDVSAWILYFQGDALSKKSIRYGVSLLILTVIAGKGIGFPILALSDRAGLNESDLPTPFSVVKFLDIGDPSLMAKIVAAVHRPVEKMGDEVTDYRIDVYGNPQIGQWFEVGPAVSAWNGAIFGVLDGEITFQAVGPKGRLPQRSVLNYPVKGMKIQLHHEEFTAWGVQNPLTPDQSFYVKVEGNPREILFGEFPHSDQAEIHVIRLA